MENAPLFLDKMHLNKNMGSAIGAEKTSGLALYEKALYAPTCAAVEDIKSKYGPKQTTYLQRFRNCEIYRAYSSFEDTIVTSQGAKPQMRASLINRIRGAEPQKMLTTLVDMQR